MTLIHSRASYGGWRRVSHRPRRASLLQKALAAVRDWRRRLQDRNRSSAFDERTLRDSGICRNDTLYHDSKQIERVSNALREVPGLNVVQTGTPGQLTSVFMRGFTRT